MTLHIDFTSQAFFRDPAAALDKLRAAGPVVAVKLPFVGRTWIATTQDTASHVLKDSGTFTLRKDGGVAGVPWWMPVIIRTLASNMLTMDEPDHSRLRGIVDEAFRRRAVLGMEPRIYQLADGRAADLFADGSPADLVARFARKLPLAVICELLGLPAADRPKFSAWAGKATSVRSALGFFRVLPSFFSIRRYMRGQLDLARKTGGHGLIAELIAVEKEGARISSDEMIAMVFLLLFAGSETTAHLISGSVYELVRNHDLRDWLIADGSRLDLAVEEFLRFVAPVQFTKPRFVRKAMTLGGAQLKPGDKIMAMLTAANRDPAANDNPDKLDLARRPNRHMAFGTGIHFCLGHQLARIEAQCALPALFARWPTLALAIDPSEIRWRPRLGLRAIERLPVVAPAGARADPRRQPRRQSQARSEGTDRSVVSEIVEAVIDSST
jgi:cytochrome P450